MQKGKFYCSVCGRITHHDVLFEKKTGAGPNDDFWCMKNIVLFNVVAAIIYLSI